MKSGLYFISFILFILVANTAYASQGCTLNAELVNQDPYPALPGDYVEILFQLNGISNNCEEGVAVDLVVDYPFLLQGYDSSMRVLQSSTYSGQGYASYWNNVYKIKIDESALEGDYQVEFRFKEGSDYNWQNNFLYNKFNITLEDGRTDFEIHIEDYNIKERDLVFQVLNVGNQDVEALTLEIPEQNNILIKGSNRNIVGDLDSNEYTNANFEAIPTDGEITVFIYYTDSINERRMIEKTVYYNSAYFTESLQNLEQDRSYVYILFSVFLIIMLIIYLIRRKNRSKKRRNKFSV